MLRAALAAAFLLLAGCGAEAGQAEQEPALELTGRVVDAADVFTPEFETRLTKILEQLEEDTLVQLVVATTPSLEGYDIADYSISLARAWGLGDAKRDDGLMVLVAPNERKVRIEVGHGLEDKVKDEEAAQIIREQMIPQFRKGNYESGVNAGVTSLITEVTPVEMKEAA
ncbi:TPM domain-containing protein [Altererythrobacter sp.]|uniref:TPM domain-containing protein n=1 Tax=Altererythrobacter sp. TaxID=1872480 RepID=UPI003D04A213